MDNILEEEGVSVTTNLLVENKPNPVPVNVVGNYKEVDNTTNEANPAQDPIVVDLKGTISVEAMVVDAVHNKVVDNRLAEDDYQTNPEKVSVPATVEENVFGIGIPEPPVANQIGVLGTNEEKTTNASYEVELDEDQEKETFSNVPSDYEEKAKVKEILKHS